MYNISHYHFPLNTQIKATYLGSCLKANNYQGIIKYVLATFVLTSFALLTIRPNTPSGTH